jgi:allophanate hydrolase subunit 2
VGAPELPAENLPTVEQEVVLDVVLGPRTDWFTAESVARLAAQRWQVTPQSNRVGLRLAGEVPLARAIAGELPSEGTALGALQVPPSGQPVLFLADHPLTGGYPVIGAVAPYHLDRAGQIPVGAWLRFNPVGAFEELQP